MAEYTIKTRLAALKKMQADLIDDLADIAKGATIRAVKIATELTPPVDDLKGANTRSGEMKQHWATDSRIEPIGGALSGGKSFITVLANNKEYASYVNDGHRMDRRFVPGLYVNPDSNMIEYDPDYDGGLVVGTQTSYIQGLHMTDKAKEEYSRVARIELDKLARRLEK